MRYIYIQPFSRDGEVRARLKQSSACPETSFYLQRSFAPFPLAFSQRRSCLRRCRLGIKRFTLPVGFGGRRGGRLLDVYFVVLDCIDKGPAIGGHARVEAHVDVRFADVASEDEYGA
jgi:hypothetical protein